jgi:hypothetical protein
MHRSREVTPMFLIVKEIRLDGNVPMCEWPRLTSFRLSLSDRVSEAHVCFELESQTARLTQQSLLSFTGADVDVVLTGEAMDGTHRVAGSNWADITVGESERTISSVAGSWKFHLTIDVTENAHLAPLKDPPANQTCLGRDDPGVPRFLLSYALSEVVIGAVPGGDAIEVTSRRALRVLALVLGCGEALPSVLLVVATGNDRGRVRRCLDDLSPIVGMEGDVPREPQLVVVRFAPSVEEAEPPFAVVTGGAAEFVLKVGSGRMRASDALEFLHKVAAKALSCNEYPELEDLYALWMVSPAGGLRMIPPGAEPNARQLFALREVHYELAVVNRALCTLVLTVGGSGRRLLKSAVLAHRRLTRHFDGLRRVIEAATGSRASGSIAVNAVIAGHLAVIVDALAFTGGSREAFMTDVRTATAVLLTGPPAMRIVVAFGAGRVPSVGERVVTITRARIREAAEAFSSLACEEKLLEAWTVLRPVPADLAILRLAEPEFSFDEAPEVVGVLDLFDVLDRELRLLGSLAEFPTLDQLWALASLKGDDPKSVTIETARKALGEIGQVLGRLARFDVERVRVGRQQISGAENALRTALDKTRVTHHHVLCELRSRFPSALPLWKEPVGPLPADRCPVLLEAFGKNDRMVNGGLAVLAEGLGVAKGRKVVLAGDRDLARMGGLQGRPGRTVDLIPVSRIEEAGALAMAKRVSQLPVRQGGLAVVGQIGHGGGDLGLSMGDGWITCRMELSLAKVLLRVVSNVVLLKIHCGAGAECCGFVHDRAFLLAPTGGREWLPATSAIFDGRRWRRWSDCFSRVIRRVAQTGRGRLIDTWRLCGAGVHVSGFGSRQTGEREIGEVFCLRGSGDVTPDDFLGQLDEAIGYGSRYGALESDGELPGLDAIALLMSSEERDLLGVVGADDEADEMPEVDARKVFMAFGRKMGKGVRAYELWRECWWWSCVPDLSACPCLERVLDMLGVRGGGMRLCFAQLADEASGSTRELRDELATRLVIDAVFELGSAA